MKSMEILFEYNRKFYPAEIRQDAGDSPQEQMYHIQMDEKSRHVAARACRDHVFLMKVGDKSYRVHFASKGEERFLSINGRNYVLKRSVESDHEPGTSPADAAQDLTAPMPGKALKIFVKNGDMVEKGDPLLILEAMKMEYTIKAHCPGKVIDLELNPNDQVEMGQILLDIAPVEEII
ncbi:MAG: hypothetical protein B6244_13000 [Candidatus Cloacimonetes bacterium 4572_55]|nr:MAG: hypothetical protein B6244_13000 [Candidatus Cloacimonetes bacterium 4572_55]